MIKLINFFQRAVFHFRFSFIFLAFSLSLFFFYQVSMLGLDAGLIKMLPVQHPYIKNLFKYKDDLGFGNEIIIVIETVNGDIFDDEYLQVVKSMTESAIDIEGIDPGNIQSLWTSNVRWMEVMEDGFRGGEIIQPDYNGSPEAIDEVKQNLMRSKHVGQLVADDYRSSVIVLPLLDSLGNFQLDYERLQFELEGFRTQEGYYISAEGVNDKVRIRIIGLAKIVGDMIEGVNSIVIFFGITLLLSFLLLLIFIRSLRGAFFIIFCSSLAVIWQLGTLNLLGFGLDPYSVLVPFLVFAIGVSHGVQVFCQFVYQRSMGFDKLNSSKRALKTLYIPGIVALFSDAIGFFTLYIIDIEVIKELAVSAGLGVFTVLVTNLVLLPIILSLFDTEKSAISKNNPEENFQPFWLWTRIAKISTGDQANRMLVAGFILFATGLYFSADLKVGDLDVGAPELWPDSRYNRDNLYLTQNYSVSADILVVIFETEAEYCNKYEVISAADRLQWTLINTQGVQGTVSMADAVKDINVAMNEANIKWYAISKDQFVLNHAMRSIPKKLTNIDCSLLPVYVFLEDHKAETLDRVVATVKEFIQENKAEDSFDVLLASGNGGIQVAVNEMIRESQLNMLLLIYLVVIVLCFIAFRSLPAVACIVLPLVLTSILCQGLMAVIGIGVKVSTLPVIALGVGVGVDYGIYIFSRLRQYLRQGFELEQAYQRALQTTGKAVGLTGLILALGVSTWYFSPIKFQADMGLLLVFMFLWNMLGAMFLMPALVRYLYKETA